MIRHTVRRATLQDTEDILQVQMTAWSQTYSGVIPKGALDAILGSFAVNVERWYLTLSLPDRWVWVAEVSGRTVGYIFFRPPRDRKETNMVELQSMYLIAEFQGQGIGQELLRIAFAEMSKLGFQRAYCWFLPGNSSENFNVKAGAVTSGRSTKVFDGLTLNFVAFQWNKLNCSRKAVSVLI